MIYQYLNYVIQLFQLSFHFDFVFICLFSSRTYMCHIRSVRKVYTMRLSPTLIVACNAKWFTREINTECPSLDQLALCESDCESENLSCLKGCNNDQQCVAGCTRDFAACTEVCPCYTSCFDGCPCEYESKYCDSCEAMHADEYKLCAEWVHQILMECLNECPPFDTSCDHECAAESEKHLQWCPCMNQCKDGCPCTQYQCSTDKVVHFVAISSSSMNQKRVTLNLSFDEIQGNHFETKLENAHTHRSGLKLFSSLKL